MTQRVFQSNEAKMTKLTLSSERKSPLKPIIEGAIQNEIKLIELGIRKTEKKIQHFENKYDFSTDEFLKRYQANLLDETLDFDEWIGESRMRIRLIEKMQTLQGVEFAD